MLALLFFLGEPPRQLRLPLLLKCLAPPILLKTITHLQIITLKMLEFGYHLKKQSLQLQLHNKCAYLGGRMDSKLLLDSALFLFFPQSLLTGAAPT